MNIFWPHGEYRVGLDGAIILFQAFGNWNREGSLDCTKRIRGLVDSLEGRQFGVLIDSVDFTGVTPDGYSDWYDALHYWSEHNLSSVVRIDDISAVHYKAFLRPFDELFRELTSFTNTDSYHEAFKVLWAGGLNGFEDGLLSVTARGPKGKEQFFTVRQENNGRQ